MASVAVAGRLVGVRRGGGRHCRMMLGWESSHRRIVAVCAGDVGGRVTAVDAGDGGGVVVVVSIDGHVDDVGGGAVVALALVVAIDAGGGVVVVA